MITEKDIKPIPQYILKLIKKRDKKDYPLQNGIRRFYAYLAKFGGELVKVTVAVKNKHNKAKDWLYKQVAVHCVHSKECLAKDMVFYYIGGYVVGWFEQGLQKEPKWFESSKWGIGDDKIYDPFAPIVNAEYALKFDRYKYSHADKYKHHDLFNYLRVYEQYPQAEYLVQVGLSKLATSITVLKIIAKDKAFRKWLIQNRDELASRQHYIYVILRSYKEKQPLHYAQRYEVLNRTKINENVLNAFGDKKAFINYIIRQDTYPVNYYDYFNACNFLGLDMTDSKNLTPINFARWHDIRIDEYHTAKAKQDKLQRKALYKKFASVAEKYLPLQQNNDSAFIVIIARSPQDLVMEGKKLHHCVGRMNYDQKFIREESLIFFVRNVDKPDVPFVTLEYSLTTRKVLQCYGDNDSKPQDEVLEFVNKKWLPYANRKLKKLIAA
jgi:hypothetical protein